MYNVMIVDDEEPVLDSFSHMLKTCDLDFQLCGKARSGQEAIAQVQQVHPDVVFMDIGMPGIDGLDTIQELQKQFPEILFIVSTAYERFDIAKRAIPLGVFSYLVKPISKKRFTETLDKAKIYLDERREKLSSYVKDLTHAASIQTWEERNFLSLITWKKFDEQEWQHYKEVFSLSSDSGQVYMLHIEVPREMEDVDTGQLYRACLTKLSYRYQSLSTEYLGKLMVYIPDSGDAARVSQVFRTTIKSLIPDGVGYQLGEGKIHRYDELYVSCSEALQQLSDDEHLTVHLQQEQDMVMHLRKAIAKSSEWEDILQLFDDVSELLLYVNAFSVAKGKLVGLFTLLFDDLNSSLGTLMQGGTAFDFVREIDALQNRDEWHVWAVRTLRFIVDRSSQYRMESRPLPLRKAIAYIDMHFSDQLQLPQVAEHCQVSPAYLSRLFSEHLQSSFVDYLTSVRIQHAQQLLKDSRESVKEIAYLVGYKDPNYFSKIFKKVQGVSPTAYQRYEGGDDV